MRDMEARRVIAMYAVADAPDSTGDCVLQLADGSHLIGYRNEDGQWYVNGGDPVDPVEFGPLD